MGYWGCEYWIMAVRGIIGTVRWVIGTVRGIIGCERGGIRTEEGVFALYGVFGGWGWKYWGLREWGGYYGMGRRGNWEGGGRFCIVRCFWGVGVEILGFEGKWGIWGCFY